MLAACIVVLNGPSPQRAFRVELPWTEVVDFPGLRACDPEFKAEVIDVQVVFCVALWLALSKQLL